MPLNKNTQGNYTLRKSYIFPCTHKGELYTLTHTRELYNQQETDPHSYPHHIMIFTVPTSILSIEVWVWSLSVCAWVWFSDRWYLPDVSMCGMGMICWGYYYSFLVWAEILRAPFSVGHFLRVTFCIFGSKKILLVYAPSKFTLANFCHLLGLAQLC